MTDRAFTHADRAQDAARANGRRRGRAAAVAIALAAAAAPAHAEPAQDAERLFEEGKTLMTQGSYPAACSKFAASLKLESGIGTMLWLALCFERNGQMASAWEEYRDAAAAAANAGDEREKVARARAAGVEPSVSKLTIAVPHPAAGLAIERDGIAVEPSLWGVQVPVDAGKHRVVARAANHAPWQTLVDVGPNGASVYVTVPPLVESAPQTAGSARPVGARDAGRTQRLVAIAVAGAGVIAFGIGSYFGLRAKSLNDEAAPNCPAVGCNDEGFAERSDAKTAARWSTGFFVGSAVAIAAGVFVFAIAPTSRRNVVVAPTARVGAGGIEVRAAF